MKFISKPKCKRDIPSWRAYRRMWFSTTEHWFMVADMEYPFARCAIADFVKMEI